MTSRLRSTVLVTGASGFLGRRLLTRLGEEHDVIAISRSAVSGPVRSYRGSFGSLDDLKQLDGHDIDVLVHLASEIGGATEEAALSVNLLGTRRLLRYLGERGCRRFVLASSIAAAGCLDPGFVPLELPIGDRHPCLAVDAYGLSKYLAEQLADYFSRLFPDRAFVSLRIGSIADKPGNEDRWCSVVAPSYRPFVLLGQVAADDVVDGIATIVGAPGRSGARVYNLVAPDVRSRDAVADVLRAKLGERAARLDVSPYEVIGRHSPPVYAMTALRDDCGFVPTRRLASVDR